MSKHETKMTRWYAKTRYPKGFLMEEFPALKQGKTNSKRLMDGVIVFRKPFLKRKLIKGERVVVIQSKNRRLGMGSSARSSSLATSSSASASRS